jgi:hypothetical protein
MHQYPYPVSQLCMACSVLPGQKGGSMGAPYGGMLEPIRYGAAASGIIWQYLWDRRIHEYLWIWLFLNFLTKNKKFRFKDKIFWLIFPRLSKVGLHKDL